MTTQPTVPEFDTDELLTATKLNQLGAAVSFTQAVDGTYTPVISGSGSTPVVGASGYLTGKWARVSNHVSAWIELFISGAGSALVGTSWRITLPFAADLTLHTANLLSQPSDRIGGFQTHSTASTDALSGNCLLAGPAGSDTTGTAIIFYAAGSTASIGSGSFTTTAKIKASVHYVADPTLF